MKYILFIPFLLLYNSASLAQRTVQDEINTFAANTGAVPTIDKATNSLSFLRFPNGRTLKLVGTTAEEKALTFLRENRGLLTIKPGQDSYLVKESKKDNYGLEHVEVQQYFNGVPVYDGTLKFHFNRNFELTSLNGNFISVIKLNTAPSITGEEAGNIAIKRVTGQKRGNFKVPLKVKKNRLLVFQKGLAQGYNGAKYLVYEVEVSNDFNIREFVYIDAHSRATVEQFSGIHNIHRILYEETAEPENKKWEDGVNSPGALDKWQEAEVESSGHIYNLMKNAFGFISYDNNDAPMITINNNSNIECPDATWNGLATSFCTGSASDDIVAHEWAHAYTEHTSGLVYDWQPGALNESFSDIWGETVDILNGYMDEDETNALRTGCESSLRWQIGEKATAYGATLRDMWDPNCKGQPGKVSDPQYLCTSVNEAGDHINSGILNHAYALLVDGGTYNGQTINALGLTKTAHIFWHAQAHYMTSTTDFAALGDILKASLADLTGVNLRSLSTAPTGSGLSGEMITGEDAGELAKAILAVELSQENQCNFMTILKPLPALCNGALPANAIFYEDFESGMEGWSASHLVGNASTWTSRDWILHDNAPAGREGKVLYGVDFKGGDCLENIQNGAIRIESPVITIPAGSSGPYNMAFDHYIGMEGPYDGGNIKYKINNGSWKLVPATAFTANGYNVTIDASNFNANPLQGEPAFSGLDEGAVVGTWGQSRIDLTSLGLRAGQKIQFRWDVGTDGCVGLDGWYIDNITVYSCALPTVQFVSASDIVSEAEAVNPGSGASKCLNYIEKTVTIRINKAPSAPVTVTLNAPTGTASEGITADFSISSASFILDSHTLSKDVVIRIYNDAYVEGNETFELTYNIAGGDAYPEAFNQKYSLTIVDDDIEPEHFVTSMDLLTVDFNSGLPAGWNIVDGGEYPGTWTIMDYSFNELTLDAEKSPFLFINSDAAGEVALDKVVESAPFNTVGLSDIELSFIEYFQVYPGSFDEKAIVEVWDGAIWQNLLTQDETSGSSGSWEAPNQRNITIPAQYANPAMKIRFRYIANYDYWWAIDHLKITAKRSIQIQSAVSSMPDTQYLGPNATAYFYDPNEGNLITKIRNLSDHDYGCTTVSVDRAGVDETDWLGAYKITNKTFKVTPANNNPAGKYEITLFYKTSELPEFNGRDIRSMGKSPGSIGNENIAATSFAEVQVGTAFNADYAYTATFDSGFSGFGLSDAPPIGSLPVTLVNFEGKNTTEGNLLNWTTANETGNAYFAVERTMNGKNFIEIERVTGAGNSMSTKQYNFLDANFPAGISYYRLKQVDSDGKFAYSRIVSIHAKKINDMKFYPNPVQSMLTVELPENEFKSVNVSVVNSAGQQVLNREKVKNRNGRLNVNLANLPSGIYQLILSGERRTYHISAFKL